MYSAFFTLKTQKEYVCNISSDPQKINQETASKRYLEIINILIWSLQKYVPMNYTLQPADSAVDTLLLKIEHLEHLL